MGLQGFCIGTNIGVVVKLIIMIVVYFTTIRKGKKGEGEVADGELEVV